MDDMLGIEPLEIHYPFALDKPTSSSIKLTNNTEDYIAFRISTSSLLQSTRVHQVLTASDITEDIFDEELHKVVDEVNLPFVFDAQK
jgi:hypothetical protein